VKRLLAIVFLDRTYKVVRVKSWRPYWGKYGLEWPTILADRMGTRSTVSPVLNWDWLRSRFADGD
jgi:hypothetical protein